jgi:hypothetical protein
MMRGRKTRGRRRNGTEQMGWTLLGGRARLVAECMSVWCWSRRRIESHGNPSMYLEVLFRFKQIVLIHSVDLPTPWIYSPGYTAESKS